MKRWSLVKNEIGHLFLMLFTLGGVRIGNESPTLSRIPPVSNFVQMQDQKCLIKSGYKRLMWKTVQIFNARHLRRDGG